MNAIFLTFSMFPLVGLLIARRAIVFGYLVKLGLLGCLFVVPVLIRNLILSGYILFPSTYLDIFSFDWKLPAPILRSTIDWISNHAIYQFTSYEKPILGILDSGRAGAVFELFRRDLLQIGLLTFLTLAAVTLTLYLLIIAITKRRLEWQLVLFSFIFILQFALCYITSPTVRYAFGYIGISTILPFVLILSACLRSLKPGNGLKWFLVFSTIVVVFLQIYKPSLPISLRDSGYQYPIKAGSEIVRALTYFPELIKGKQKVVVINHSLRINVSDYDGSYSKLERISFGPPFRNTACGKVDFLEIDKTSHGSCEAYNALVSTMTWMDPVPSVGAIYHGLNLRGLELRQGFKIVLPANEFGRKIPTSDQKAIE